MTTEIFKQNKEKIYSKFDGRCRRLLVDFLREKNKEVCAVCSESCSDGEKAQRTLRYLVGSLAVASLKRCDDRVDILMCLLAPYLSTAELIGSFPKSKKVKLMAKELANVKEKLIGIATGGTK